MAKMFYTIDEVSKKLGKSEDEILEMARTGQLQEFRDRDKLMFKVEQIDLLAGDEDTGEVHLELDDSGASGLGLRDDSSAGTGTGTGIGLADSREGTGISVFDTDHGSAVEMDDASDQTQEGDSLEDDDLTLEAVGSGSGLLDLTRESDDTSLGAELLEEVYSGDEHVEIPANASGLFEAAGADSPGEAVAVGAAGGGMAMPMVVEAYDGSGSGFSVGFLLGAVAALVCTAIVVVVATSGATPDLAVKFADNLYVWLGGLAGISILGGLVGLFIGKASE